jgi:hypothetical protein
MNQSQGLRRQLFEIEIGAASTNSWLCQHFGPNGHQLLDLPDDFASSEKSTIRDEQNADALEEDIENGYSSDLTSRRKGAEHSSCTHHQVNDLICSGNVGTDRQALLLALDANKNNNETEDRQVVAPSTNVWIENLSVTV